MSRIGGKAVNIPDGVKIEIKGNKVVATGPKGTQEVDLVPEVEISNGDDGLVVIPRDQSKRSRSMWGMSRSLVSNVVTGVSSGFEKRLEINGVGYRAQMRGDSLQLTLGFSHEVLYKIPNGITVSCPKPTEIVVNGISKSEVGQCAAEIRKFRPPEPYKGKGVRYAGEYIFMKEGKKK